LTLFEKTDDSALISNTSTRKMVLSNKLNLSVFKEIFVGHLKPNILVKVEQSVIASSGAKIGF